MLKRFKLVTLALVTSAMVPLQAYAASEAQSTETQATTPSPAVPEVVVTAQKRSEKLIDVPISVSLVTANAAEAAGILDTNGLAQVVPALRMDVNGSFSQPTIRGVSSSVAGPGISANIATYIDGFYIPDPLSTSFDLVDLQSVQVLKGPQGTLFGRNSTGGAILVTTLDPSFTPKGELNVSYGNYNEVRAQLYASGPLTDSLAASISISGHSMDGFVHNIVTGDREGDQKNYDVRGKLLWKPTSYATITLTFDHGYIDNPYAYLFSPYDGETDGALVPGNPIPSGRDKVAGDFPSIFKLRYNDLFLKGKFDLGWATLTSYTGYQEEIDNEGFDLDVTNAPLVAATFPEPDHIITQEVDLGSSGRGPLDWVTGIFVLDQKARDTLNLSVGGAPLQKLYYTGATTDSVAAFADATYRLTDKLFLTAGGRYSYDDLSEFYPPNVKAHTNFSEFTPRGAIRYAITPQDDVYASVSQGSKSGAFNPDSLSTSFVQPERITSYEIGYKTSHPRWQFDGAGYLYEYDNLQVVAYHGPVTQLLNAARAEIYGVDGHFSGAITDSLRVDLGAAYIHARYLSFPGAPENFFSPSLGGVYTLSENATGNTMQRAPELSGNVTLTYHQRIMEGLFELSGNYSAQSKIYYDFFENTHQNAYGILNIRAAWTMPNDKVTFAIYGKNLTDQVYRTSVLAESTVIAQTFGTPITYGVQVIAKF